MRLRKSFAAANRQAHGATRRCIATHKRSSAPTQRAGPRVVGDPQAPACGPAGACEWPLAPLRPMRFTDARSCRITAAHRARLNGGELLAQAPRLDWSKLLRRTFACEVLVCPRCSGRARVIAAVHDPAEARRFLTAIDERSTASFLPRPRVRDDDAPTVDHHLDVPDDYEPPPPSSRQQTPPPATDGPATPTEPTRTRRGPRRGGPPACVCSREARVRPRTGTRPSGRVLRGMSFMSTRGLESAEERFGLLPPTTPSDAPSCYPSAARAERRASRAQRHTPAARTRVIPRHVGAATTIGCQILDLRSELQAQPRVARRRFS